MNSNFEICKNSYIILQEITTGKLKLEAAFLKMTQERETKYISLQSKQRDILQVGGVCLCNSNIPFLTLVICYLKFSPILVLYGLNLHYQIVLCKLLE